MRTLGNIIWHIPFLGFLSAALVYLIGILLVATLVAAPIGLGLMEYAKFLFAPFTRAMVSKSDLNIEQNAAWKAYSAIIMLVYLPFGLILAFIALCQVILLALSIIGIPLAIIIAKSLGTYLNPVNKKSVHVSIVGDINRLKAYKNLPLATTTNLSKQNYLAAGQLTPPQNSSAQFEQKNSSPPNSVQIISGSKARLGLQTLIFPIFTIIGIILISVGEGFIGWFCTIACAWYTVKLFRVYLTGFNLIIDDAGFEFGVFDKTRFEWHGVECFKIQKEFLMPKKIEIKFSNNYKLSAVFKNIMNNKNTIPNIYSLPLEKICEQLNEGKSKSTVNHEIIS